MVASREATRYVSGSEVVTTLGEQVFASLPLRRVVVSGMLKCLRRWHVDVNSIACGCDVDESAGCMRKSKGIGRLYLDLIKDVDGYRHV